MKLFELTLNVVYITTQSALITFAMFTAITQI